MRSTSVVARVAAHTHQPAPTSSTPNRTSAVTSTGVMNQSAPSVRRLPSGPGNAAP